MNNSGPFAMMAKGAAVSHVAAHVLTGSLCACTPVILMGALGAFAWWMFQQPGSPPDASGMTASSPQIAGTASQQP